MTRRDKIEIVRDVLVQCRSPTTVTGIVYSCNLNFKIVRTYLDRCFTHGWLQKEGKYYLITKLGEDYLKLLDPVLVFNEIEIIKNF